MLFNPDPNKQAIEICISHKHYKGYYSPVTFHSANVESAAYQKHLDLILNCKPDFNEHNNKKICFFSVTICS